MTQLDDAAHETVAALRALAAAIEDAREACTDALAAVAQATSALEADRTALADGLRVLEDALPALAEGLSTRVASARAVLARLGGAVAAVGGGPDAASAALDAEAAALSALDARVREVHPDLEAVVVSAESVCRDALGHASGVEAELTGQAEEAEVVAAVELGADVERVREALAERGQRVGTLLLEVCQPRVQHARDDWDEKETVLRDTLDDAFADMRAHAETLAIDAPLDAQAVLTAAVEDAVAATGTGTLALVELAAAAAAQVGPTESTEQLGALAEADAQVRAAAERVESVRARWRGAGFGG